MILWIRMDVQHLMSIDHSMLEMALFSFGYRNCYSLNDASLRLGMPKGHPEDGYMLATIGFSLGKVIILWIRMDVQHLKPIYQNMLEMAPYSFGYRNYYSLNEASLRLWMPKGHTEDGYMVATIGFSLGKAMILWIRMDLQYLLITSFNRKRWRIIRVEHAALQRPGT